MTKITEFQSLVGRAFPVGKGHEARIARVKPWWGGDHVRVYVTIVTTAGKGMTVYLNLAGQIREGLTLKTPQGTVVHTNRRNEPVLLALFS